MSVSPLSGLAAALIGVVALVVVVADIGWSLLRYGQVLAHEGAHVVVGTLLGQRVGGVQVERNSDGGTEVVTAAGMRGHLTLFAGYLGPSLFGLGGAKLIELGHATDVLWIVIFLLAMLALRVLSFFTGFAVAGALALVFAVGRFTPVTGQVIGSYAITWLMLLSGVRRVVDRGVNADDAAKLRTRTGIPRLIWALLWLAGTLGAVAVGGSMLILHH